VRVVDEKQAEELRKAVGSLAVPSLRVGREVQKGFEQSAYHALLDTAGYPRTGILPPRNQAAPADKPPAKPPAEQPPAGENTASDDDDAAGRSAGPYVPR
jgi:hypothetical protein